MSPPVRSTLKWYLLFGALHELSHVVVALWLGLLADFQHFRDVPSGSKWLVEILILRRWELPINAATTCSHTVEGEIALVRHFGWIFSLVLAGYMACACNKKSDTTASALENPAVWAALVTALEAISTDLLGLERYVLPLFPLSNNPEVVTFFCGNFGLILLNPAYSATETGRKTALDILEKMISVTMVRGAQSGGVVSFISRSSRHRDQIMGLRSRVLNSKRTDLSKGIRSKIESDASRIKIGSKFGGPCEPKPGTFVKTYSGHTRFATSSLASFDGTHPHQWTPPRLWRCYNLSGGEDPGPNSTIVENFITHNGDFDFYDLNGMSYGLDSVQSWLEHVTSYEMPSAVDSAAIAGMVDILHSQGCCKFFLINTLITALAIVSPHLTQKIFSCAQHHALDM
jgi:hypothetical protein